MSSQHSTCMRPGCTRGVPAVCQGYTSRAEQGRPLPAHVSTRLSALAESRKGAQKLQTRHQNGLNRPDITQCGSGHAKNDNETKE